MVNGLPPAPDLSISKTSNVSTANVGDTVVYTLTLANNGPDNATGVIVTDILHAGLNFVTATPSVGSYATSTGIWTVGNLNNASSATLTIFTTVKTGYQGQTIPNTATTTANQTDPTPGNNTSTVTVVVNGLVNHPPVLTLVGANPATVNVGSTYTDPGATALDQEDGDITANIIASSTVNSNVVGTYTVIYNVSDSQGLAAVPVSRTVNVIGLPAVLGKISFCLVLTDTNNAIATSSNGLPAGIFSMNLATSTDLTNTSIYTRSWMTTTFSPNRRIILGTDFDSDCVTYDNLALGTYYYSTLSVTGGSWLTPQYNDQNNHPINNVFDFFAYSPELFNATSTDDAGRNLNSDGQIVLTSGNRDQTLVVFEKDGPAQCVIPPVITSSLTASGFVGQPFTYTVTANSVSTTTYSVTGLPAGLTFSTTTNTISGTPTTAGVFNITLNAVNECVAGIDTKILVLTITTPTSSADISVVKTADKTSVNTGDAVTYTITVTNIGTSHATGVVVTDVLHAGLNLTTYAFSSGTFATTTGVWTIGNLNHGSSTTMTLATTIKAGYQGQTIPNTAVGTSALPDPIPGNNTSTVNVSVNNPNPPCTVNCGGGGGGGGGGGPIYPNNLTIFNEQVVETVPGIAFVTWNTNLPATRRVVYGNTSNPTVGSAPNYGYSASTETVSSPLLTAHGMVVGIEANRTYYFREISTDIANGSVRTVVGKELVLNPGIVPNSCYYLYDFLRADFNNNPVEVRKLQVFLRDLEGFNTVQITGVYDAQTIVALDAFQNRYAGDILTPWGHTAPTSYTYILTKKKVNEIYCQRAFPVTPLEQVEIDSYRAFLLGLQGAGIVLPPDVTIPTTPATTTPLTNDIIGVASSTNNTTLAGVSTTTTGIMSRFTANVSAAWGKVGGWTGLSCPAGGGVNCACRFVSWLLLIIILVVSYLWYREWDQNRKIEKINKEIDLK